MKSIVRCPSSSLRMTTHLQRYDGFCIGCMYWKQLSNALRIEFCVKLESATSSSIFAVPSNENGVNEIILACLTGTHNSNAN
jgi:hypothetical protein